MFGELSKLVTPLVMIVLAAVTVSLWPQTNVTETTPLVLAQPKQTPHVIYIAVCGALEGIVITTDPLVWADTEKPATPELRELEAAAIEAKQVLVFNAGVGVDCDSLADPLPEKT